MRILHCPKNWGGNPWGLVRAERKLGFESRLVVFEKGRYGFDYDEFIESKSILIKEVKRWILLLRAILFYDVVHFSSGSSIMPDLSDVNRYKTNSFASRIYYQYIRLFSLTDLPILKFFKKKIVVTFFGDDARQKDYCVNNYKYTFAREVKEGYYLQHLDDNKKLKINRFNKYADEIYYTNPDLMNFLPSRSKFLPYTSIFPDEIKHNKKVINKIPLILHVPSDRAVKGTKYIMEAISRLEKDGIKFRFVLVENKSNNEVREAFKHADLLIDQLLLGWYGTVAVEAMVLGIPVMSYIRTEDLKYVPADLVKDLPIININPDTVYEILKAFLTDKKRMLLDIGQKGRKFVEKWHDPNKIALELNKLT